MKIYEAKTVIRAPRDRIWRLLTDAPGYPAWNPTIEKLDGTIALGHKIELHVKASGRAFSLQVTELVPGERMVWTGGLPLGLFKGERTYTLADVDGAIEVTMREVFSGVMAGVITKKIPDLQPAFEAFVAALKQRAEQAT